MGLDVIDGVKLGALRLIRRPRVFEVVGFHWPVPDGLKWYCSTQVDELPGFPDESVLMSGVMAGPVEARLPAYQFQAFGHLSDISDDSVQIELSDIDGAISDLYHAHGEGVKVELCYYFPQVDLLVSTWWGHLR